MFHQESNSRYITCYLLAERAISRTLCHFSVRDHWSFDSPVMLLSLCQHPEEMTPQTSCSSQMRPEGGAM